MDGVLLVIYRNWNVRNDRALCTAEFDIVLIIYGIRDRRVMMLMVRILCVRGLGIGWHVNYCIYVIVVVVVVFLSDFEMTISSLNRSLWFRIENGEQCKWRPGHVVFTFLFVIWRSSRKYQTSRCLVK